ncbi:M48 family metalloprotease [Spirilliplanes yamanashiensis]|uniref:Peptidase M48 domain-containing protein n=1 Tax=Spirilliplanes yamanashiensis TaxID=42233 RepID=A0A8J3YD11_9ACTN|nr:M48 family metalloprotease [Spirilliplanes yamanashiensis]MDP9816312.1 Zn-dependent protease with chaperone function [Spirilliplanes yamanashiensis]GIJ05839.1 hypothetical protein Sya03_51910 [Spirilliplanes yamanashiensis]
MPTALRGRLAVLLLAGSFVVAGAELLVVVAVVFALLQWLPTGHAVAVAVPLCIAPVGALAYALRRALHVRHAAVAGVPVTRADAPRLWSEVDELAAGAQARTPDALTVVADATVTVVERSRLLGLLGGRRELVVGLPVLQALDVDHLRALLAHELAHDSRLAGRARPAVWRGRHALDRSVARTGPRNVAAWPLRGYARLVHTVSAPVLHAHELAADRYAARAAGPRAAAEALRDLPMLVAAQQLFHAEYLGPGWQAGHVPDDVFGGLLRMLAARADDLAAWRATMPDDPDTTHPPLTERLAALTATPPNPVPPQPTAPAEQPVPAPAPASAPAVPAPAGSAGASAPAATPAAAPAPATAPTSAAAAAPASGGSAAALGQEATAPASAPAPTGPAVAAGTVAAQAAHPTAGAAPSTAGAAPSTPSTPAAAGGGNPDGRWPAGQLVPDLPGLGLAVQAIAFPPHGRTALSWDEFFGAARTAEMEREADGALQAVGRVIGGPVAGLAGALELAEGDALVPSVRKVFPDLDPDAATARAAELVTLLLALAALGSGAARWRHSWTGAAELVAADGGPLDLAELADLAVRPDGADKLRRRLAELGIDPAPAPVSPPAGGAVVGGLVNLAVDGARADLLILDTGLVLVPGLPRTRAGEARPRLARLAAAGDAARLAEVPGTRFVPWAELAGGQRTRRTPRAYRLDLRAGGALQVRAGLDVAELAAGWAALEDAVAFVNRPR